MIEKHNIYKDMIDIKNEFLLEKTQSLQALKAFCDKCDEDKRLGWAEEYGHQKGLEQGISIGQQKIIQHMYNHGLLVEEIAQYSGISIEEVQEVLQLDR